MEADKPSGPIATVPDSPASSNPNKLPASSSYLATTVGSTTAPPPLHPLQLQALHNAHSAVMDLDTTTADDRSRRATSVISMDDLEAAQALEGLRSDFGQSPRVSRQTLPAASPDPPQPEPLLSLLTSSHPLISSAINGSVSAYTTSKSYSARFKSGAEFIERNIGSPVANTVGTVGRKTGVESGLRWALQRRESGSEAKPASKRRKVSGEAGSQKVDEEKGPENEMTPARTRSSSDLSMAETLPPYDEMRSPRYEEKPGRQTPPTWQSRLVISTSGLGVAMSEESLRSLQYCLTWLRWANGRLGRAIVALQNAMTEWENHKQQSQSDLESGDRAESASLLTQRIQAVKADVLSTLKQVVDVVSKYAGGALPENARHLVRRHLTSLPHRFQMASTSQPPPDSPAASSDATVGAHRILVLANEGLDILGQVSGVVNDTLVSAEHWCERLGRKRPEHTAAPDADKQNELPSPPDTQMYGADIKQPIVPESAPREDVQMTGTEKT
ncbi:clock controled protein [Penicillium brasilianum]|uniref:Clock controled protein n=1 Tax=Penicillium brasilianum TaxID=104259 RepID=A0A1S9RUJ9_PENBI|nr:clock controled protein [Penicillium brasilianum]